MEPVSNERLAELIASDEAWRDNADELYEDERRFYEDRIAALTELREMRKVLNTFTAWLSAPGANGVISIERYDDGTFTVEHHDDAMKIERYGRDKDLGKAMVALVERGEA